MELNSLSKRAYYDDGSIIKTFNIDEFNYCHIWDDIFQKAFDEQLGYLA
jgi:hypothetical protein